MENTTTAPIQILSFERHGTQGWSWAVRYETGYGATCTIEGQTNGEGAGLWLNLPAPGALDGRRENRQVLGTAQFRLPSDRTQARRKLRTTPALQSVIERCDGNRLVQSLGSGDSE